MIDIPSIPIYSSSTGSFGTSRDLPSLDLAFALDKTLTARRGPTPVFSRGTSATLVNESGLIQYAPENLFLNNGGAFRTSALATKYSSNELDPDGGSSCLMVVETNVASQARTELPSSFADAYTRRRVFSWWVKPSPGVTLPAYLHLVYKDNARVSFSTATWSVATQTDGATGSIVESNGWYKLIAYLPGEAPSSTTHKLVFTDTDYYGGPLTAIRGLLVGSNQLSSGTFAWPHFQTLTNPYYAPRFDHDPVTLACKGLLIEEPRTNFFRNSNPNTWIPSRVSLTATTGLGFADQATILTRTTNGSAYIYRPETITVGQTYVVSCRVKAGTSELLMFTDFTAAANSRVFNANTGVWPSFGGSALYSNYASTALPDGWYLISFTYAPTGSTGSRNLGFSMAQTPEVIGETISIDTPQLEIGSFPTSYIPTTGTALQRSADVCSVTTDGWSNAGNDTMVVDYFVRQRVSGVILVEGGPAISWMSLSFAGLEAPRGIYRHGDASTRADLANTAVYSLTSINKFALTSGEQLCSNGNLGKTVGSDPIRSDISTILSIGSRSDYGGQGYINGHIARIRYFRKRLPDAKLQSLTTP